MTVQRLIAISVTLCILAASSGYLGAGTFADAEANPDGTQGLPWRKLSGWWGGGWGRGWGGGFNRIDAGFCGGSAAASSSTVAVRFGRELNDWGSDRGFDGHRGFFNGGRDFDGHRSFGGRRGL